MTFIPETIELRRLRYDKNSDLLDAWREKEAVAKKESKNGAAVYAAIARLDYDMAAVLTELGKLDIIVDCFNSAMDRIEILERAYAALSRNVKLATASASQNKPIADLP